MTALYFVRVVHAHPVLYIRPSYSIHTDRLHRHLFSNQSVNVSFWLTLSAYRVAQKSETFHLVFFYFCIFINF